MHLGQSDVASLQRRIRSSASFDLGTIEIEIA
jgi:hypothetical protein